MNIITKQKNIFDLQGTGTRNRSRKTNRIIRRAIGLHEKRVLYLNHGATD